MWYGILCPLLLAWSVASAPPAASFSKRQIQGLATEDRIQHVKTCPQPCAKTGNDFDKWSHFHNLEGLAVCPEPLLLAFNLYTPLDSDVAPISIRACTLGDASTEDNFLAEAEYVADGAKDAPGFGPKDLSRRAANDTVNEDGATCGVDSPRKSRVAIRKSLWAASSNNSPSGAVMRSPAAEANDDARADVVRAIKALADQVKKDDSCDKLVRLGYVRGTLVGIYSGALIEKTRTSASLMERLADEVKGSSAARVALEVCDEKRTSASTFGVVADASGDFAAVQRVMKAWSGGECVATNGDIQSKANVEADVWSFDLSIPLFTGDNSGLQKRADCRSIRVEYQDDCGKLATRCGIGNAAFTSFNRGTANLCSTLKPGQPVCCSSGTLPDVRPKPGSDGSCAVYSVEPDEGCSVVAAKHGLDEDDLEDMNKKTWGWDGCGNLLLNQRICVSSGDPPMPATFPDAVCGPTKPDSKRPTDGTDLADINPCPLKVCCNVWGNCGTTSDFCTISKTKTGNPGTSNPGENGCQSSCGTEIVNNDKGPAEFRKIAYYEGWNFERPCLHMNVLEVDRSYTHVHFAFGEISADMQPVIPENSKKQWEHFVGAKNYPKKILAFGGWAFSNEGPGANRLREAVSPANRHAFSDRVAKFAIDNGLDGLDFDWEYPGATDIEGSPPGNDEDGDAYLAFLQLVRVKIPRTMSLSIAVPASYWYLRNFPIDEIAFELDYIVYMTYDFHGQWDAGNKWAQSGCDGGNCLRSHVNSTITHDSFVMITKAGVPTHKIVVGVSSYGRSFKMTDSSCRGPQCTYDGGRNQSPAKPGRCTGTGGYISNFEIDEIVKKGGAIKSWYDQPTDTDYLVYDQVEWVGYMTNTTKTRRMGEYKGLNMGGTSDWAVDLQGEGTLGEDDEGESDYEPDPADDKPLPACVYTPTTMQHIINLDFRNEIEPHCATKYLISVMHAMLKEIRTRFTEIMDDGYDKYFGYYADHVFAGRFQAMFSLMMEQGDKFFNCEAYSKHSCCPNCGVLEGSSCKNCIRDCNINSPYHDGWEWRKNKMPCPPDFSGRGWDEQRYQMESVFWSFKSDEAKKEFLDEASAVVGVPSEDVSFPEHRPHYKSDLVGSMCYGSRPPADGQLPGYDDLSLGCQAEHWWHTGPAIGSGFTVEDVFNPKTEIAKTINDIDIEPILAEYELSILADEYDEDASELVDALVLPVFMMSSGLDYMEVVVEMGKNLEEAERISFITNLVSALLLVVGGFGGVAAGAASAGLRLVGRTFLTLAELGNTGLGLYFAVSDPTTTPLLIFGLVMSATGLRSAANISKAAKLRQAMTAKQISDIDPNAGRLAGIAKSANSRSVPSLCKWG